MPTRTKSKAKVQTTSKTVVALLATGLVLSSAAAGLAAVRQLKQDVSSNVGRPYQTQGYVPGYVPGYIPGQVPGYAVPGYVPGYGWFQQLNADQFREEFKNWIRDNFLPL